MTSEKRILGISSEGLFAQILQSNGLICFKVIKSKERTLHTFPGFFVLAAILGTEGDGLAESTLSHCDYRVCIPMAHGVDSLNVAAASAVAFWALKNF